MPEHDHHHHHHHHGIEDEDSTYGMALGFRIVEEAGELYLAEAEISPYTDAPDELGVTLVFHPLAGIDPVEPSEEVDWPAFALDIDDDLTRESGSPIKDQFQAIIRQLHGLTPDKLRDYLRLAREESPGE